jgi:hypothetical protein
MGFSVGEMGAFPSKEPRRSMQPVVLPKINNSKVSTTYFIRSERLSEGTSLKALGSRQITQLKILKTELKLASIRDWSWLSAKRATNSL